jgi:tetratricopeptide (TPR) repeat protein
MATTTRKHEGLCRFLLRVLACSSLIPLASSGLYAADDPLARARALYNARQFEAAVSAAEQARALPSRTNAADLVAARAYLERYRDSGASDDLTNARERFRRLNPGNLTPRERTEYIVGLGETLYLDGAYGAAATVFDSVLEKPDALPADARDRVLDWWATAIDRDARPRPEAERLAAYQRIRARMEQELVRGESASAAYWLPSALRSQGDLQGAWDAAQAGWVRAPLSGGRAEMVRADIDQLVVQGLVPDRAHALGQPVDALRLQWEQFKERWKP